MSGLSFGLGQKRPLSNSTSKTPAAKKPANVSDLFSADSDDDDHPKKGGVRPKAAPPPALTSAAPPPAAATRNEEVDAETREVADKLAEFVAKNGRQFEQLTREKNPGDTPFRFLHNKGSAAYRYYQTKLSILEAKEAALKAAAAAAAPVPPPLPTSSYPRPPAAPVGSSSYPQRSSAGAGPSTSRVLTREEELEEERYARLAAHKGDSIAAMEAYMAATAKRDAARQQREDEEEAEERRRRAAAPLLNETSFDRRKVVAVYKSDGSRGHHMGDYIPEEELAKFLSKQGDAYGQKKAAELEAKSRIGADNIGHKLLQKMGWKEGEALGGSQKGITAPVQAAGMGNDSLGLGATAHGEVTKEDDPFEAYRKRMMLGYKYRPNPLGNPRKAYY